MTRIDLHTHSTFSDGSLTPTELVSQAIQSKISVLALTDHDSTDGLSEAINAARDQPIELIPGIELSARFQGKEVHILGYFVDRTSHHFQTQLSQLRKTRTERVEAMVGKLQSLGLDLEFSEVQRVGGNGAIGRPHIAHTLLTKGYVRSIREAFERFLGSRGKAYVPRNIPSSQVAMSWIKEAGGISILAHPSWQGYDETETHGACQELVDQGLEGLEVFYGNFSARQISKNLRLAHQFNLLVTGGSDYHGSFKPEVTLGKGSASVKVPTTVLEPLRMAATQRQSKGLPRNSDFGQNLEA